MSTNLILLPTAKRQQKSVNKKKKKKKKTSVTQQKTGTDENEGESENQFVNFTACYSSTPMNIHNMILLADNQFAVDLFCKRKLVSQVYGR